MTVYFITLKCRADPGASYYYYYYCRVFSNLHGAGVYYTSASYPVPTTGTRRIIV